MKYMVIPIHDVQAGDVLFANREPSTGVQVCGRVLGHNLSSATPGVTELRVLMLGPDPGESTVVRLKNQTPVGVVRDDNLVEVDVAAILADF